MSWPELVAIAVMWFVTIVRAPRALGDPEQRTLWAAVALIAAAMTLHMESVLTALGTFTDPFVLYFASHVFTVADGTALVCVMLAAGRKRKQMVGWLVAAVLVTLALLWLFLVTPMTEPADTALPLSYWWLFAGFHFAAMVCCVTVCLRSARRAQHWSMRFGLTALGLGLVVVCAMWVILMAFLITGDPSWTEDFAVYECVEALLIATGALLPVVNGIRLAVRNLRIHWRLTPLWSDLVAAVPNVALGARQARLSDWLWPRRYPLELRVYRRVIETRDAILTLRDYVGQAELDQARERAGDAEPAFTAQWVELARQAKLAGGRPGTQEHDITQLGGADIRTEIDFLLQVAAARRTTS